MRILIILSVLGLAAVTIAAATVYLFWSNNQATLIWVDTNGHEKSVAALSEWESAYAENLTKTELSEKDKLSCTASVRAQHREAIAQFEKLGKRKAAAALEKWLSNPDNPQPDKLEADLCFKTTRSNDAMIKTMRLHGDKPETILPCIYIHQFELLYRNKTADGRCALTALAK